MIKTDTYALAMTLGAEGRRASYHNALSMCERFRISQAEALQIISEVREVTAAWEDHFRDMGVSEAEIKMLRNSFKSKE